MSRHDFMTAVSTRNLTRAFQGRKVLSRVTLDIPRQDTPSVELGAVRCEEGGAQ